MTRGSSVVFAWEVLLLQRCVQSRAAVVQRCVQSCAAVVQSVSALWAAVCSQHVGLFRPCSEVIPSQGTGGTIVAQSRAFWPIAQARFLSPKASRFDWLCSGELGVHLDLFLGILQRKWICRYSLGGFGSGWAQMPLLWSPWPHAILPEQLCSGKYPQKGRAPKDPKFIRAV